MADIFNKKKRSQIMAKIRGKGTSAERTLSFLLRELGLAHKRHYDSLPGTPDFVLAKHKVVIFVNGCFWHGHLNCRRAALPTTNRVFWVNKIRRNKIRDMRQRRLLRKTGWHVITFWTCSKITREKVKGRLERVGVGINGSKQEMQGRQRKH